MSHKTTDLTVFSRQGLPSTLFFTPVHNRKMITIALHDFEIREI